MAEHFTLQVITPFGVEVDAQVTEVEVPSADGEIGFLPGHVPFAGILDIGLLHYKEGQGFEKKLIVKKGFCSFLNDKLTVLADAVRVSKATPEEIAKKADLNHQLTVTQDQLLWQQAKDSLKEIEASEGL